MKWNESDFWPAIGAGLLTLVYVPAVYFEAATASLNDRYQPGIDTLQLFVMPGALLCAVFLAALLGKSYTSARLAFFFSRTALFACALLFLLTVIPSSGPPSDWVFSKDRSLAKAVKIALLQPSFSNRSSASVVGSGILAFIIFIGSSRIAKKRHDMAANRTRENSAPVT